MSRRNCAKVKSRPSKAPRATPAKPRDAWPARSIQTARWHHDETEQRSGNVIDRGCLRAEENSSKNQIAGAEGQEQQTTAKNPKRTPRGGNDLGSVRTSDAIPGN